MGIVNLTPDSFSDGGEAYSVEGCCKKVEFLRSFGTDIFDFGAESTAPTCAPIDGAQERKRFDLLFECFDSLDLKKSTLSIDTYRPRTFSFVCEELLRRGLKGELIWNDVSGVLDEETLLTLKEYRGVHYVFSYTSIPTKAESPRHMDFIQKHMDTAPAVLKEGFSKLSFMGRDNIIFDLCFGFSKTREQNYRLLAQVGTIVEASGVHMRWLWGLSRKSMFAKSFPGDKDFFQCELIHILALKRIKQYCPYPIFRVHDPRLIRTLEVFDNNLERSKKESTWTKS